jgi:hypothetical protein
MSEMMTVGKNSNLRRQSMELLKNLTDILREMISSGDVEGVQRLQEWIDSIRKSAPRSTDSKTVEVFSEADSNRRSFIAAPALLYLAAEGRDSG